jgi:hypothetical protein
MKPLELSQQIQGLYNRSPEYPTTLVGTVAVVLLAAGLIFPYVEIVKREGRAVGISKIAQLSGKGDRLKSSADFVFLAVD